MGRHAGRLLSPFELSGRATLSLGGLSVEDMETTIGDATISFLGSASYKGKVRFDTLYNPVTNPWAHEIIEPGYWLFSARITVSDIALSGGLKAQIALFGDNLTNEKYSIQNIDFRDYATKYWGLRRSFGIEGKITF